MSKIIPIGEVIFVKPDEKKEIMGSGMSIPKEQQENTQKGTIIAVGPGVGSNMQTKEGDTVLFGMFSGAQFQDPDHGTLFIMKESGLLAILT